MAGSQEPDTNKKKRLRREPPQALFSFRLQGSRFWLRFDKLERNQTGPAFDQLAVCDSPDDDAGRFKFFAPGRLGARPPVREHHTIVFCD
jgi:hypothetical protein